LTYVDWQVTFAISPLIRGISLARKILLADDSVTAQNMGRKILADAGYEVIAVNNGSAALKKINELKPDLVVLDVYMPGYSGLEVCQRLKEVPETARIPVLLTVGKLEPFKPEEAQRVRAEGYIVKPFEASELLSALSKLEDKVVPRSEGSKPGRFARAIAAVEEGGRTGRGDDNGWKSRISFPSKKAEEEKEKKSEEQPSTYNQVNRDLRTVVEPPAEKAGEQKQESSGREPEKVDVAALAPSGVSSSALPTDVTQEEVAAIAAAAAQIQMASATIAEENRTSEATSQASPSPDPATVGFEPPMREIDLPGASPVNAEIKPSTEESKTAAHAELVATAERTQGQGEEKAQGEDRDVPVTIAATAESVAGSGSGAVRWTAVAVALESEEAAISLEQEMQRVYEAPEVSSAVDSAPEEKAPAEVSLVTSADLTVPASAAPIQEFESGRHSEPVASATEKSDAEKREEKESESDRSSFSQPGVSQPEAATVSSSAVVVPAEIEASSSQSAEVSNLQPAEVADADSAAAANARTEPAAEAPGWTQLRDPNSVAEIRSASQKSSSQESYRNEVAMPPAETETAAEASAAPAATRESQPAPVAEFTETAGPNSAIDSSSELAETAIAASAEPEIDSQPESDAVKHTAAAWASWRQIRDNNPTEVAKADSGETEVPESAPVGANAAAVAAGAEQALQMPANSEAGDHSSGNHPEDVASIVDSVLADLRPKLMKEISRKMSEKK
jgi:CheY-like chemotaxis protein